MILCVNPHLSDRSQLPFADIFFTSIALSIAIIAIAANAGTDNVRSIKNTKLQFYCFKMFLHRHVSFLSSRMAYTLSCILRHH